MSDELQNELIRRKRLGQYFSGTPLARLLGAIAEAKKAQSIIDPMCGDGDMLDACQQDPSDERVLVGIEIDPRAHKAVQNRLTPRQSKTIHLYLGDCFSKETLMRLPQLRYDLVITNPPYIRYQSLSHTQNGELRLPNASEIRKSLLNAVDLFPSLDEIDRILFRHIISNYSGLSDIAVPSWILCAMLTDIGGTLAMVVPESWLSRDYARIIQYLLLRWFKITYVVEDSNAVWFPNALVKTTLLVAERVERRDSAFSWEDETFLLAHVPGTARTVKSVVGELFQTVENPERRFATFLKSEAEGPPSHEPLVICEKIPLKLKAANVLRSSLQSRWLVRVEPGSDVQGSTNVGECEIPAPLVSWLGHINHNFHSPGEFGVNVSQGLRTGANQFFYVEYSNESGQEATVIPQPIFNIEKFQAPRDTVLPVLRKQSELGEGFRLNTVELPGRVLALQRYALPEDISQELALPGLDLVPMPKALAEFVRKAATTNVGTQESPEYIPQLSAVRTNVRTTPPRFWYMLPSFALRHRPDLFLARVNYKHPRAYLNTSERVLIDANFSTVWLEKRSRISELSLLAILNSSWCVTAMELIGCVMGGGALKLEASHLRRLPIPEITPETWKTLDELGRQLINGAKSLDVRTSIDKVVVGEIFDGRDVEQKLAALTAMQRSLLAKRNNK
jgi:hypothetical protein